MPVEGKVICSGSYPEKFGASPKPAIMIEIYSESEERYRKLVDAIYEMIDDYQVTDEYQEGGHSYDILSRLKDVIENE